MKIPNIILILIIFFSWEANSQTNNSWQQVADYGGSPRLHAVSFTIGNFTYVGLGNDGSNFLQDFWKYDSQTNTWSPIADFIGSARDRAVAFSLNGKGYVGLGLDAFGYKKDFFEYNPSTDSWVQVADFFGSARIGSVAFTSGSKGYVGTGNDGLDKSDFYSYSPETNAWNPITSFSGGNRRFAVSFSINDCGYVGTGLSGSTDHADFWKYDTLNNIWLSVSPLPGLSRAGASAFSIGNFGFVGTGNSPTYLTDFWEYNSTSNSWTQRPDFIGSARELGVGFSVNGNGYIGTGYSTMNTNDVYKYIPICNEYDTTINVTSCESYVFGSQVYTVSGQYSNILTTTAGCDSIMTINLTIRTSSSSTISPTVCGSYTAPDGTVHTSSGTFTSVIPNAAGCDSTITVNLTVNPYPTVDAGSDQTVCEGNSVTLNATGATIYTWDNGSANGSSITPTGTATYIVTGTSAANCTSTDQVTITIASLPVASFSSNVTSGCGPLQVSFTNTTLNTQTISWSFGNGSTSNVNNPLVVFPDTGCFDVSMSVTDQNGCSVNTTFTDTICVFDIPVAGFYSSSSTISDNQSVTFTNTSTGATSYLWDLGDGSQTATSFNVNHLYDISNEDSITVQLIAYTVSGCSDTSYLVIPVATTPTTDNGLNIPTGFSPNNDGENDSWTITGLENYPKAVIQVFNRWGQLLFDGGLSNPSWDGYFQGKLLPTADYYFIVDLGTDEKINGVVTLKQ